VNALKIIAVIVLFGILIDAVLDVAQDGWEAHILRLGLSLAGLITVIIVFSKGGQK
jgi:xanthine/uracil permease